MCALLRSAPLVALLVAFLLLPLRAVQAADVVTSIRPLGLITAALTDGITQPRVLLEDGASPHHYALRPSDMQALMEARLVVWIGPELERFLDKPLARTDAHTLALMGDADTVRHEHANHDAEQHADHASDHQGHDAHEHHDEPVAEDMHHDHDHAGIDVHPWLDPITALKMAQRIHAELLELYPRQQARLEQNLAAFRAQIEQADAQIEQQLAPLRNQGFYVFHDAYTGFVEHYGLNQLGYFTVDPARKPGARHLAEIRTQLEEHNAVCVLSEPQFSPSVVKTITSGLALNQGELDPLASGRALTPTAYGEFLLDLAARFERCLATPAQR